MRTSHTQTPPTHTPYLWFVYELAGAPRRASGGRWAFGLRSELLWVCAINKVINQPIRTRAINQSTNQKSRFPNPRWPPIWRSDAPNLLILSLTTTHHTSLFNVIINTIVHTAPF